MGEIYSPQQAKMQTMEKAIKMKIIKNEKDYEVAMARLIALMSLDLKPKSEEENEFELLTLVIQDYEQKTIPPVLADPVESILFRMDQMQLTRKELEKYIGSSSKVSEVLSRKRPLSLPMIRRLNQGLGIPAEILIEDVAVLDDIPTIDFARFPLKEMSDRGCFQGFKGSHQKLKEYAEDLVKGFMSRLPSSQMAPALLRAPMHQRGDREANEFAIRAWQMCVLRQAGNNPTRHSYKENTITPAWMRELAKLSVSDEGPRLAKEHLARHGISLIVEKHFKSTFLDGAAMLDANSQPIVALTLRHDRVDNFWFALMHELAHVAKHLTPENSVFIDNLEGKDPQSVEAEADAIALEALIPAKKWRAAAVRETLATADAIEFAKDVGVHPAIVAGRIRHEQGNYRLLSSLIGKTGQVSRALA